MLGSEEKIVEVKGSYNVKPGDIVDVLMNQSMGFTALTFGYILPFMAMLAILITMIALKIPELTAGLVAVGTLIPYYYILYCFRDRLNEKFIFTLKV